MRKKFKLFFLFLAVLTMVFVLSPSVLEASGDGKLIEKYEELMNQKKQEKIEETDRVPTAIPPDSYEIDDDMGQAMSIDVNGASQSHNFHDESDIDWIKFPATAGDVISIETFDLGGSGDTAITLYNALGEEIEYNDDKYMLVSWQGDWDFSSRIIYVVNITGTYYVKIEPWSSWNTGYGSEYKVKVETVTLRTLTVNIKDEDTSSFIESPCEVILVEKIGSGFYLPSPNGWDWEDFCGYHFTDTGGTPFTVLDGGEYYIYVNYQGNDWLGNEYADEFYNNKADSSLADKITITGDTTIDILLGEGYFIKGYVKKESGEVLLNAWCDLFDAGGFYIGWWYTSKYDPQPGQFSFHILPSNYRLSADRAGYYWQFYDNKSMYETADVISVTNSDVNVDVILAPNPDFTDVPPSHWAYDYIEQIYDYGIVSGYGDGTYGPSNPLKRSQFTKIIVESMLSWGIIDSIDTYEPGTFSDVSSSYWAADYIMTAYNHGVVSGKGDGRFDPTGLARRSHIVKMVIEAFDILIIPYEPGTFSDVSPSYWAADYIMTAKENEIVSGYTEDNTFRPENNATRAQIAKVICNVLD